MSNPTVLLQRCVWILSSHKSLWGSLNGTPDFKDKVLSSRHVRILSSAEFTFLVPSHFSAIIARTEVAFKKLLRVLGEDKTLKRLIEDPSHSLRKL